MSIRRSFGAVAVPVTSEGAVLAIPYLNENHGKQEGLAWSSDMKAAVGPQYPGGAEKEEDKTISDTMAREWREETEFDVEQECFEQLPIGTAIRQGGGSRGDIWFGVTLFKLILTEAEEAKLRDIGAVEVLPESGVSLRPRDMVITNLYLETHSKRGVET